MDNGSVLKQIREHLRERGYETYYPAQHEGECLSEYVVVAFSGTVDLADVSSVVDTYELMCYVPRNKYSTLMTFVSRVRESMRWLFPLVRETGVQSTSYYDEDANGHMISMEYANYRKTKYRE